MSSNKRPHSNQTDPNLIKLNGLYMNGSVAPIGLKSKVIVNGKIQITSQSSTEIPPSTSQHDNRAIIVDSVAPIAGAELDVKEDIIINRGNYSQVEKTNIEHLVPNYEDGNNVETARKRAKINDKIQFNVKGTLIEVNKTTLSNKAPYLSTLLIGKDENIEFNQDNPIVFQAMIDFIENDKLDSIILDQNAREWLAISDKYKLDSLKKECETFFLTKLCTENADKMHKMAIRYSANNLKENVEEYLRESRHNEPDDADKFW